MQESLRQQYLQALGVQCWELRPQRLASLSVQETAPQPRQAPAAVSAAVASKPVVREPVVSKPVASEPAPTQARGQDDVSGLDWPALRERVAACTACELHGGRTQTVFGVGDPRAEILFVGEAPGAEEDRQGEPFVGRAGMLLNEMLAALNLKREQVYIANILKCRPPNNRDPRPEEVVCCEPFLHQQIRLLQPRVMVALGRIAAHNLLKTDTALARLRGQAYQYGPTQIPLYVTYHPAYLLRNPADKRKAWEDLQAVRALCERLRAEASA